MVTCVGRTHERETLPFWPDLERAKGVGRKVAAPPPIMAPAADILAIRPSMAPLFAVLSGGVLRYRWGCPRAKRRFGEFHGKFEGKTRERLRLSANTQYVDNSTVSQTKRSAIIVGKKVEAKE